METNPTGPVHISASQINDYQKELARARSRGDRPAEAKALADLGTVYGWRSEYAEAIAYLKQSLAIARELGNKEAEWRLLWDLGVTYDTNMKTAIIDVGLARRKHQNMNQ